MDVGVREFKKNLSAWLDRAERGEIVRITDRGRAKVILGPLPGRSRLEEGIEAGWIRAAAEVPPAKPKRHTSARRIDQVTDEDRGE